MFLMILNLICTNYIVFDIINLNFPLNIALRYEDGLSVGINFPTGHRQEKKLSVSICGTKIKFFFSSGRE